MEPQDQTSREYAELLAQHLVSGDKAAYRALKQWGDGVYRRANADLVAWAETQAALARWVASMEAAQVDVVADDNVPEKSDFRLDDEKSELPEPVVVAPKRTRSRKKES